MVLMKLVFTSLFFSFFQQDNCQFSEVSAEYFGNNLLWHRQSRMSPEFTVSEFDSKTTDMNSYVNQSSINLKSNDSSEDETMITKIPRLIPTDIIKTSTVTKKYNQKTKQPVTIRTNREKISIVQKLTTEIPKIIVEKQENAKLHRVNFSSLAETNEYSENVTIFNETDFSSEEKESMRINGDFQKKTEKPQAKIASNISQNLIPLPAGAEAALVKPTKYHYYPHNQHIYLLPECAIQQVCNAVYVRLNWTQPLCACPSRYKDPCSASLNSDDLHTTELVTDPHMKRALTLVKTCEPTTEMRLCRTPRDWSLLALQNIRTGKSHYLVICRCPDTSILEGPMSHDQPTYASVPGIRVYGMMCVESKLKNNKDELLRVVRNLKTESQNQIFPRSNIIDIIKTVKWN